MAKLARLSTKRIQIDKANSTIVVAVGVAAFVAAFSLVSVRSLLARRSYQAKVIVAQETARDQLKSNIAAVDEIKAAYQSFVNRPENIIGGNASGNGDRDGDNAKIVLDALPSVYDYPALATSLEKILVDRNYRITSITGTDDEANINQAAAAVAAVPADASASEADPAATGTDTAATSTAGQTGAGTSVEMPFQLGAEGNFRSISELLSVFQKSIRPINIQKLSFSASDDRRVQLTVDGISYFQPEKTLQINYEVMQ